MITGNGARGRGADVDIATLVDRAARRFGDRIAVEGPDAAGNWQQLSFAALGERVARLAAGLRRLGLQPGDRVLDLQTNSTTYAETDLAVRAAGLVTTDGVASTRSLVSPDTRTTPEGLDLLSVVVSARDDRSEARGTLPPQGDQS
jgi:non-ribosomal peptide synthetase component E (peptide arylation enzyme)